MTHRFPLKEIARQAGLSTATIDRAMNGRAHVSPQTKARVTAAISELEGQEAQLSARGRRLFFDFVIEAPNRFSQEIKRAAEDVLPRVGIAVCRPRFVMHEIMDEVDVLQVLARIAKRGSHGVCLKVRDVPKIRAAVDQLVSAGIPVVTLVTDISNCQRKAYAGLDNQSAGRTAAYLIAQSLGQQAGSVLATRSQDDFLGEGERFAAFAQALGQSCPNLRIITASGGGGTARDTAHGLADVIDQMRDLKAVYSMGGGNAAILDTLDQYQPLSGVFVAHDLDAENLRLVRAGRLTYVLYHDLEADIHNVYRAFLHHHKLAAAPPRSMVSSVQVVTPLNLPM